MYFWSHTQPILQQLEILPGKLEVQAWPPAKEEEEGEEGQEKNRKDREGTESIFINEIIMLYSGPCDLRPLCLIIPCILRPDISNTTCVFSVYIPLFYEHLQFKITFCWMNGLS